MAAIEIWDHLSSDAVAANTTETFTVDPQRILTESGEKYQTVKIGDDDSEERISFSNQTVFKLHLQWDVLNEADSGTIFDFWHSTAYGCGTYRSFRYTHPTDTHTYTVRFDSPLTRQIVPGSIYSVNEIVLKVLGRAT